jgi:hypothetical protein
MENVFTGRSPRSGELGMGAEPPIQGREQRLRSLNDTPD